MIKAYVEDRSAADQLKGQLPDGAKVLVFYGGKSAEKSGTLPEIRKALGSHFF
nr:hypothetical protein [Saccharibacter sp. 17.LH.SD]